MIDIKKAEEEFIRYTKQYDRSVAMIDLKIHHTFRVEKLCERIALLLGLPEEKVTLAMLIGLLHDIARFKQYTIYRTFNDKESIDHGDFGVEILEKDEYIRAYIQDTKYDEIIKKAIHNHNKLLIEEGLTKEEELFCKIIRDADKLDILYLAATDLWKENKSEVERQCITDKIWEDMMQQKLLKYEDKKSKIDGLIIQIAYTFDLNFKESFQILFEENYINQILAQFDFQNEQTKKRIEQIKKEVNTYIQKNKEVK